MKCEEFKNQIHDLERNFSKEVLEHLESCRFCSQWMDSTLKEPPKGFSSFEVDGPSIELGRKIMESAIPRPSWYENFVRNLLAALSIGAAAACVWLLSTNFSSGNPSTEVCQREEFIFLSEEPKLREISFMEPFPNLHSAESHTVGSTWSFIEKERKIDFMEDWEEGQS